MDISKNSIILVSIVQVLLFFFFVLNILYFRALDTKEMATIEGIFLAIVALLLFINSYIQTDQSYFNGKKENQRKYD